MLGHVRLICFDLDDTLWPCHPVIHAAEAECYDWLDRQAPRLTAKYSQQQLREHRIALGRARPEIAHDMTALRLSSLGILLCAEGYPIETAHRASAVFRAARNRVTPYAEVIDALQLLRGRYTLVSVTNGNSQIEYTPLQASFDHSLSAADVGAAKPDPAIFHAASAHSGVPLETFLHVGDDPLRDVQAARGLGLSTVWVNRNAVAWPVELAPADREVTDIGELAELLMR